MFQFKCVKFCESHAIVGPVGLVPSSNRAFVGISWVGNFFSWVFCKSFFSFFLMTNSWIQDFFSLVFCGSNFLFIVANFVIQRFSVVDWTRKSERKQKYINTLQTLYSIPNRFQQLPVLYLH